MLKPILLDFTLEELNRKFKESGEPVFRGAQLFQSIYRNLITDPNELSSFPKQLRSSLDDAYCFMPLQEVKKIDSEDQRTSKLLFQLPDGAQIEAVLMRYRERNTICISTQVGCAMNCVFCATGQMGFTRNLSAGEIIAQILYFAQALQKEDQKLTNIVIMGMGEPFRNYEAVMKAVDIINHPEGMRIGERRITISTAGVIPGIEKFAKAKRQINLAISLHAPTQALRSQIMPINQKYPLDLLMGACKDYTEKTRRRLTFEYALIHDVNDSNEQASQLSRLLHGMLCHVNLIPLNPTKKYDRQGSPYGRVEDFKSLLDRSGIPCSIRLKRGIDIGAGCGQLISETKNQSED